MPAAHTGQGLASAASPMDRLRATASRRIVLVSAVVISTLVLLILPFQPLYHVTNTAANIYTGVLAVAIAALGLDILVARTGQLSLAHAAFLGIAEIASINFAGRSVPWPLAIVGAMVVTGAAAVAVGLPNLRIRGLQVAIASLAFQLMCEKRIFTSTTLTGSGYQFTRPGFISTDRAVYVFGIACLALTLVIRRRLAVTKAGRNFLAVRDVERRTPCFGVESGSSKLLAYAISGALVGLGGALLAIRENGPVTDFQAFGLLPSLQLVAIVVIGGAGSAAGIIIAAFFTSGLPLLIGDKGIGVGVGPLHAFTLHGNTLPLVAAGLLIVAVRFQPQGIGGGLIQARNRLNDLFGLSPEKPDPRPRDVDLIEASGHAESLRVVPRTMSLTLPVRALLEAEAVSVRYGGVNALTDITLEVRRGEIIGLIGANGAGKSTFFNAVSGFAPTTGRITYKGVSLLERSPVKRTSFGVARTFQDMGLVRSETVKENVLLVQNWLARYPGAAGILGLGQSLSTERDLRKRADLALELFGLDHLAEERLGDLPYGTMRIVEIAAAVAAGPDLLLLDEATAGLGPEESYALGDRFTALRDELGLTLVIIEHHVPLVARVCDYCYCLESGQLIAEGTPAEVIAQPRVVESFLGRAAAAPGGAH
ncbi:MAG: hypothetical protein NVS3B12_13390 [Acidimicrobiales bacterium]